MKPETRAWVLAAATAIAVPMEGMRQYAYRDPVGIPTICMGSTKGVKMGDFRTIDECKALLTKEMLDVIQAVDACRPGLPPPVLAAFSDAAYNVGNSIACDSNRSTAARMLNIKNFVGACQQLLRWDKAKVAGMTVALPGLTKRRKLDYELCMTGT